MILHYLYDPLCGWCYGFSPVIEQFMINHKDEMDIEVVSGGMVRGESEKPLSDMADYLRKAYKRVEEVAGVKFGKAFLDKLKNGQEIYSSVPASIALSVYKSMTDDHVLKYASALQSAIYYDGIGPDDQAHFTNLAVELGLDRDEFTKRLSEDFYRKNAYDDFSVAQQFQVQGYPTVILHYRDEYFLLCRGYTDIENLEKTYNSIIHS